MPHDEVGKVTGLKVGDRVRVRYSYVYRPTEDGQWYTGRVWATEAWTCGTDHGEQLAVVLDGNQERTWVMGTVYSRPDPPVRFNMIEIERLGAAGGGPHDPSQATAVAAGS